MRIAMIGQKGIPAGQGGVERHVHELSLRLVKRGFDVRVYGRKWYTKCEDSMIDGIQLIHTNTFHSKHLDAIIASFFASLHAIRSRVDVIHYHGVGPSLLSWIPRIFAPKILVIATFHSIDRKHQKWGFFARLMLRLGEWAACKFPHRTISVSRTIYQYARDVYDAETTYVPNATTCIDPFESTELLEAWGLESKNYVLLVSRLIPHKGIHYAIDAWKNLLVKHREFLGNKKMVIVGDGYYTDAYVASLKQQAKDCDSIIFTGFQSGETLRALFSHAQIMVHPSNNEGLPIGVLEAMSYGLPVLVSDIVEHEDLIKNEAYLFERGNIESLEEKLFCILSESKENCRGEGLRNKALIQKEFSWESVVLDIIAVYASSAKRKLEVSHS